MYHFRKRCAEELFNGPSLRLQMDFTCCFRGVSKMLDSEFSLANNFEWATNMRILAVPGYQSTEVAHEF
jgi:hypothetical protein